MTGHMEDEYPDHLTIINMHGGGDNTGSEVSSDIPTSVLEEKIRRLFDEQQGGAAKKKKGSKKTASKKKASKKASKKKASRKKASKKKVSSLEGGRGKKGVTPPHLIEWNRLVDHIAKKYSAKGKKRGDAMKEAKKIKDSLLVKDPNLNFNKKKLTDEAIRIFDSKP